MTMKHKSLEDKLNDAVAKLERRYVTAGMAPAYKLGYSWGAHDGFKAGYRAGKRGKK